MKHSKSRGRTTPPTKEKAKTGAGKGIAAAKIPAKVMKTKYSSPTQTQKL